MLAFRAKRFSRRKTQRFNSFVSLVVLLMFFVGCAGESRRESRVGERQEFIRVSDDGTHFVLSGSGSRFTPWGFNYDHDRTNRLLEYYWKEEWTTVAADFAEMKALGANTVRIHLQVSRFMKSAQEVNRESFDQLARLLRLAESTGLSSTSPDWVVTTSRTCRSGTTTSTKLHDGRSRLASGRQSPASAAIALRYSVTT